MENKKPINIEFGSFYPSTENYTGISGIPNEPIACHMTFEKLNYDLLDRFDCPDHFIVSDDCPVTVNWPRKVWWKPWTWFLKDVKFRVPNGTRINIKSEGEYDD